MSDTASTSDDTGQEPGGDANGDQSQTAPDTKAPEPTALKKALDAERAAVKEMKARLKELEPLAQAAREAEEANKTEVQKANEKLAREAEGRMAAERQLLRFEVAAEKGVPSKLVSFLAGSTREEMAAAADVLLEEINGSSSRAPFSRPVERLGGAAPTGDGFESLDPIDLASQVRGGMGAFG